MRIQRRLLLALSLSLALAATFVLNGRLFVTDIVAGTSIELSVAAVNPSSSAIASGSSPSDEPASAPAP